MGQLECDLGCDGLSQAEVDRTCSSIEWLIRRGIRTRHIGVCHNEAELLTVNVSGTSRRKGSGAIAPDKNDCNLPLRRQLSRIPSKLSNHKPLQSSIRRKRRKRRTLPLRNNRDGNRLGLTKLLQEGPHTRPTGDFVSKPNHPPIGVNELSSGVSHSRPIFMSSRDFDFGAAILDSPTWSCDRKRQGDVLHRQWNV